MMKIEMFEKVGEIEIISLRPACENKMIAEAEQKRKETERKRKAEEEERRKEEEARKNAILAKAVIVELTKAINKEAENGGTRLYLGWHNRAKYDTDNYTNITWNDFINTFEYTRPLLESAGYKVGDIYQHSDSWRRRSGKIGYIHISW